MVYKKDAFTLEQDMIYLDGNSLGPLTKASQSRLDQVINQQWRQDIILSWNKHNWFMMAEGIGDKIAAIIGAPMGTITVSDSTSINLFKCLHDALGICSMQRPNRKIVMTDNSNFPGDLYMINGVLTQHHTDYQLKIIDTYSRSKESRQSPTDLILDLLDDEVALLVLTHVGYNSGYKYDLAAISRLARSKGIMTIWDLSHSAGAMEVDIWDAGLNYAIGCTYKYLNGGPGSPAFVYDHPDNPQVYPVLPGWMGHLSPFDFELSYTPAEGIRRYRVGTPSILSLTSLDAALDVFDGLDMSEVESEAQQLISRFIKRIEDDCPQLSVISPGDLSSRSTQILLQPLDEEISAYAVIQNLINYNIIGDFRPINACRFGISPLYLTEEDIDGAVEVLSEILASESWKEPAFHKRNMVT